MKLKIDVHTHSKEDPRDKYVARHSSGDLVEKAIREYYNGLAITHHDSLFFDEEFDLYAQNNSLVLIPGSEVSVKGDKNDKSKGRHVLVYCQRDMDKIKTLNEFLKRDDKTLEDIRTLKKEGIISLVIAPHSFYYTKDCLNGYLEKNIDLFDALELNWFHTKIFPNRNKLAQEIAERYNIPMFSASDTHNINRFGKNYAIIDIGDNTIDSVLAKNGLDIIFDIIKNNEQDKIKNISPPVSMLKYVKGCIKHGIRSIIYY